MHIQQSLQVGLSTLMSIIQATEYYDYFFFVLMVIKVGLTDDECLEYRTEGSRGK